MADAFARTTATAGARSAGGAFVFPKNNAVRMMIAQTNLCVWMANAAAMTTATAWAAGSALMVFACLVVITTSVMGARSATVAAVPVTSVLMMATATTARSATMASVSLGRGASRQSHTALQLLVRLLPPLWCRHQSVHKP